MHACIHPHTYIHTYIYIHKYILEGICKGNKRFYWYTIAKVITNSTSGMHVYDNRTCSII